VTPCVDVTKAVKSASCLEEATTFLFCLCNAYAEKYGSVKERSAGVLRVAVYPVSKCWVHTGALKL